MARLKDAAAVDTAATTRRGWISASLIALSSFLYGYVTAALNACLTPGAVGSMQASMTLSIFDQELATSLTLASAMVATTFGQWPCEKFGRRKCLLWNNVLFATGSVLCIISDAPALLFLGRLLAGFGVGLESVVAPILLSEIASDRDRGKITTMHQLFVTIGILVSGLVAYVFVPRVAGGWRLVLVFPVLIVATQLAGYSLVPESPRWLVQNGHNTEALAVLRSQRHAAHDCAAELEDIERRARREAQASGGTWTDLFGNSKAMIVGMGLMIFQPLSGINAIIYYSSDIFAFAGVTEAILSTVSVFGINVVMTVVAAGLMDRLGPRVLLLVFTSVMVAALVLLGVVLKFMSAGGAQGVLAVALVLLFICGFAIGLGAATWTVMSEVLPTNIRSKGFSLFVGVSWLMNLIISLTTLSTIDALGGGDQKAGVSYLFWIFGSISALCVCFLYAFVPRASASSSSSSSSSASRASRGDSFSYVAGMEEPGGKAGADAMETPLVAS